MGKITLGTLLAPAALEGRTIETITADILESKRVGGEAILNIGRCLIEAKAMLPHGEWLPWLTERVEFSERTAQNFMRLSRQWSNPQTLADLGASKALALLALPAEERDTFLAETHVVDGREKSVIDMSARQLEAALRERDEARRAAEQAKADARHAEESRSKMAQDMALLKQRVDAEAEVQADPDAAPELAAFELLLGQCRELTNELMRLLVKARCRGDQGAVCSMREALRALSFTIRERME